VVDKLNQQEVQFLGYIYRKPRNGHYLMKKLKMDKCEFSHFINGRISKLSMNYLKPDNIGETQCFITPEGRASYEYARKDFRDDVKYAITTAISLVALIIAIISLLS